MRTLLIRVLRGPGSGSIHIALGVGVLLILWSLTSPSGVKADAAALALLILAACDLAACILAAVLLRLVGRRLP